jgi:uncharacterized protein YkwD
MLFSVPGPTEAMTNNDFEGRTQYHINKVRGNHDKPVVKYGGCVDRSAERYAERLSGRGVLVHSDLGFLERCNGFYAGEVLAVGFRKPANVVRAWMNSPTHRAVLMNERYDVVGIGVKKSPHGKIVVAQFLAK